DAKDIAYAMKNRNRIVRLISVLVGAVLLIWAVAVTIALIDSMQHRVTEIVDPPVIPIETTRSP
ncbi:MAG: hypothetical protein IJR95_03035, partial [Lachnospiraceae bacterium]|nr:hypothetical protein [Lachnospiraceae bacterium]